MKTISENVCLSDNPLLASNITKMRDKRTDRRKFRSLMTDCAMICGIELSRFLDKDRIKVKTPLGFSEGIRITDERNIIVISILRAALPFSEGLMRIYPYSRHGVVSAKRAHKRKDEEGFEIETGYINIPKTREDDVLIISDPMLASASTLIKVLDLVSEMKHKKMISLSLLSSEYGIMRISKKFPSVLFVTCAIDKELDDKGYIVPGLGDAGDRSFG